MVNLMVELVAEPVNRTFESLVLERGDTSTVVTDEMVVMMLAIGKSGLEPSGGTPNVEPLHKFQLLEQLEGPIDGRNAHASLGRAELVSDVRGAEDAALLADRLEDSRARSACAMAGSLERTFCVLGPLAGGRAWS